ncbi:hypothetical protein GCM10022286_11240 [Gryllotalpicola daejeonensis]|uniref:Flagellar protein FliT n=1 Tax=Gryllotalpicola daejeonensis TaxID=993087 RepID=A0ABP7ZHX1_9MICO
MSPEADEQAWRELLSSLEAEVRTARAGEQLEPWQPPAQMPPLPASLLTRALALLEAQAELRAAVTAQRDEIRRALARTRRAAAAGGRGPVYLDAVG